MKERLCHKLIGKPNDLILSGIDGVAKERFAQIEYLNFWLMNVLFLLCCSYQLLTDEGSRRDLFEMSKT